MRFTNATTAFAPSGVACPTVSAMQTRDAPARIAAVYSVRIDSGSARVVSSVTYITDRPSFTAKPIASSVWRSRYVHRPPFRELANRTGPDERADFDRDAGPLADLDDRRDVGDDGARGAVRVNRQPLVGDRAREPLDVGGDLRARRPAGRGPRCRCRGRSSAGECRSSRRSSACGSTATAVRPAASRRRASATGCARRGPMPLRFQS